MAGRIQFIQEWEILFGCFGDSGIAAHNLHCFFHGDVLRQILLGNEALNLIRFHSVVLRDLLVLSVEIFIGGLDILKLCNLLYLLSDKKGGPDDRQIHLSQEELADVLAVNRVNLSRHLSRLRQEGIISTGRKQIQVLRPDLLADFCSSETV